MTIAILTTSRSDFGLLKRLILQISTEFDVDLLITGSHFLSSRGFTFNEIHNEFSGKKNISLVSFDCMKDDNTPHGHMKSLGNTQIVSSKWFDSHSYDLLLYLGDRWELWGVTLSAFIHRIPLAHISGGEITEGVIDDAVRHSHTKMSSIHFAASKEFAKNLSLMGEEDWRIKLVGECGLDQIYHSEIADESELKNVFDIDINREIMLVTYHMSTLETNYSALEQINTLLQSLKQFPDHLIVFTAPGMEIGSDSIMQSIVKFVEFNANSRFIKHLGSKNYLAIMKSSKVVIGNSSSGLVEASSFGVPAVNIGNRQKNRPSAKSVIHVGYNSNEITIAINKTLEKSFQIFAKQCENPYDPFKDGRNSNRILTSIKKILNSCTREELLMKKFNTKIDPIHWSQYN